MLRAVAYRTTRAVTKSSRNGDAMQRSTMSTSAGAASAAKAVAQEKAASPGDGPNHRSVMTLDSYSIRPYIQPNAFVAPSASIIGSVTVNDGTFVMYGAVVRGDLALISIGVFARIGENSVLTAGEVSKGFSPSDAVAAGLPIEPELFVGDFSNVGADVKLDSCFLDGDNVIGHGASVGKGSRLERYAELLPRSTVGEDMVVGEDEVWGGSPAVKIRTLNDEEKLARREEARATVFLAATHSHEFLPGGTAYWEKEALEKEKAASAS